MDASRIDNDFGFHPATEVTGPQHDEVRLLCRTLAHELNELLPEGRHKSLAIAGLESVMHRANAAIACDTPKSQLDSEGRAPGDPDYCAEGCIHVDSEFTLQKDLPEPLAGQIRAD